MKMMSFNIDSMIQLACYMMILIMTLYNKGEDLFKQKKYSQAIEYFNLYKRENSVTTPKVYLYLIQCHLALHQYQAASKQADACIQEFPQFKKGYSEKIRIQSQIKRSDYERFLICIELEKKRPKNTQIKAIVDPYIQKYRKIIQKGAYFNQPIVMANFDKLIVKQEQQGSKTIMNVDDWVSYWQTNSRYCKDNLTKIFKQEDYQYALNLAYLYKNQYNVGSHQHRLIQSTIAQYKSTQKKLKNIDEPEKMDIELPQGDQFIQIDKKSSSSDDHLFDEPSKTQFKNDKSPEISTVISSPRSPVSKSSIAEQKIEKREEIKSTNKVFINKSQVQKIELMSIQNGGEEDIQNTLKYFANSISKSGQVFDQILNIANNILASHHSRQTKSKLLELISAKHKEQFKYMKFSDKQSQKRVSEMLVRQNLLQFRKIYTPKFC